MTDQDTLDLLQSLKKVIHSVIRKYFPNDPDTLADLSQQHTLNVWERRAKIRLTDNPRAYVIGQAHILCKNRRRVARQERLLGLDGSSTLYNVTNSHDGYNEESDTRDRQLVDNNPLAVGDETTTLCDTETRRVLRNMPPDTRYAVLEILLGGRSVLDVARELQVSRDVIYQRLETGRAYLKQHLAAWRTP